MLELEEELVKKAKTTMARKRKGRRTLAWMTLVALLCGMSVPAWARKWDPKSEREIGEKVCAEVDKRYKRWKDDKALKRVQEIVQAIAAQTERPDVKYDVRLIDTDEVNAFSIPGGFIYVTKGLIQKVQSEHELAGVLAHEIAHNCSYDALEQARRSQKLFMGAIGAALLAVLLGAKRDIVSTTVQAGLYIRQGILSRYSIEIEERADKHAVAYLVKTGKYNPVGLLTFMERLAQEERRKMPPDAGVFETHPLSRLRVAALIDAITAAGITINRRAVIKWKKPEVKEVEACGGKWPAVVWWDQTIFVVVGPDADAAKKRAEQIRARLTDALAKGARRADLSIVGAGPENTDIALVAMGTTVLKVTAADAKAQGKTPEDLASEALHAIARALTRERLAYEF